MRFPSSPWRVARTVLGALVILTLPAGAGAQTVLFSDDFEDGNSTGWTTSGGSWAVAIDGSRVFRQSGTSGDARARAGSTAWTSYAVQARVKALAFNGSGRFVALLARVQSNTSYYYLTLRNNNQLEIKKLVSGSSTTLAARAFTVTIGTWYTLRLEATGSTLRGYVDGALQLTATDGQFASGQVGLATFNASGAFDDVLVTEATPPPPTNQPPQVQAGADQIIPLPATAALAGSRSDDGLPNPPGAVTCAWSPTAGPGTVTFSPDASALNATASFGAAGTYTLTLTCSDSQLSAADNLSVLVLPEEGDPPPPAGQPVGFASLNGGVTGGQGGRVVTSSDGVELAALMDSNETLTIFVSGTVFMSGMNHIRSNKSVIGLGSDARIVGGGLYMHRAHNIIIRNLTIENADEDAIGITTNSSNIWVDHNTLINAADGLLDIARESTHITVSYNVFRNHVKTMLIGHSDGASSDAGFLKITVHHNWFDGTSSRHPRVRFGQVHVFNNYYTSNTEYGVASTMEADVLVEGNYFFGVAFPALVGYAESGPGDLVERNNLYVSSGAPETRGTAFEASQYYAYPLDPASEVPNIVTTQAGAGRLP